MSDPLLNCVINMFVNISLHVFNIVNSLHVLNIVKQEKIIRFCHRIVLVCDETGLKKFLTFRSKVMLLLLIICAIYV